MMDRQIRIDKPGFGVFKRSSLTLLAWVAVGLGVGLRADGIDRKSLWWDEVLTIQRVSKTSTAAMLEDLGDSPFPPLYYLILRGWAEVVKLGTVSVRVPAFAAALAT